MAFNIFATATSDIPLANLDANFTMIGSSAVASTLYPTATTSITYGTTGTTHYFSGSGLAVTGTLSATGTLSGGTSGTGYSFSGSAPATSLTLDSSGNLGLGVTPVASVYTSSRNLFVGQASNFIGRTAINFTSLNTNVYEAPTTSAATFINASTAANRYYQYLGSHVWQTSTNTPTANTSIVWNDAMTLDSSGNLLVGTTAALDGAARIAVSVTSGQPDAMHFKPTSNITYYPSVYINSSGTTVGFIQSTNTVSVFSTTSDYRLKNTVAPMTGALSKVALLKPCTYKWNEDGSDGQGFIAHELAEVCPQAVSGEKDAIDADGNPKYQGIDTSFLVATLTAAIQEQQALITQLTARITALESA